MGSIMFGFEMFACDFISQSDRKTQRKRIGKKQNESLLLLNSSGFSLSTRVKQIQTLNEKSNSFETY